MVDTKMIVNSMEQLTNQYVRELEAYSPEQLTRKPGEDEWSLGQMLMHLINSALRMQLASVDACRAGGSGSEQGQRTEIAEKMFRMGSFPPEPIRVPPSPQYTPRQPESKEELESGLRHVLQRMKELEEIVADIPLTHTAPHPRLGALNAMEWLRLVEMHYRHHLLQLERLKRFLGTEEYIPAGAGWIAARPRIVTGIALELAGIACATSMQDEPAHSRIAGAWSELHSRMSEIRGRVQPAVTYGLKEYPAEPFTPGTVYTYVAAVVTDGSSQPEGIAVRKPEHSDYAVFTYRGPVSGFGDAFAYIYSAGLQAAGLTPAAGYDMERYDERYTGLEDAGSETDIYVPIRR
ncbi:GyrI-like domain-containing protein [Paenibacillus chartarius]|uniref:GyrI-like domain-containing protein n=1 Tax=Paenibacillus chartarius TaxID=747481 RepID=A0ABV6DL68_9BACL